MKNTLILVITTISLGYSINWMIKTNYENEPIIVTLGLITFLIGYFVNQHISNKSSIKGNNNIVDQLIEKTREREIIKDNQSKIEGDRNEVKQKN